jgi:hypothetical protein
MRPWSIDLAHVPTTFIKSKPHDPRWTIKIRFMKGYPYQLIRIADLKTSGHELTGLTHTLVDGTAACAPA